eukprot:747306-Hanusia_phi.AAC.6
MTVLRYRDGVCRVLRTVTLSSPAGAAAPPDRWHGWAPARKTTGDRRATRDRQTLSPVSLGTPPGTARGGARRPGPEPGGPAAGRSAAAHAAAWARRIPSSRSDWTESVSTIVAEAGFFMFLPGNLKCWPSEGLTMAEEEEEEEEEEQQQQQGEMREENKE